ncbi:MAG TPA: GNAT family N-acetyltransferase [Streptosporangiaceae bacterium]|nr:GNAT family N-acetyltransferase [Streptosporangiaceae bacterium]
MRFITGGLATSRDEIKDNLLPRFMAWYGRPGGSGCWAADEKPTGAFLGWFRFHPRRGGPLGEIVLGFRLRKPTWGKGYATEGSRALMHKGFTEFGVRRVVAETMAERGVPARAGKGRPELRPDLSPALAQPGRRPRVRRRRICRDQGWNGSS